MIYKNLIINNKIWNHLSSAWTFKKLPHALLFYGATGSGKEAHAIELSALVNCVNPTENGACGTCPSCKKIKTFQHGNVSLVIPYPRRKNIEKKDPSIKALSNKDITTLREKMEDMGENPYSKIELENANTILLNSIRDLRKEIYMSSSEGCWKVVLIFDAEKLCIPQPESANALLKILEEPPPNTIFILVTSNYNLMIDTIKSRRAGTGSRAELQPCAWAFSWDGPGFPSTGKFYHGGPIVTAEVSTSRAPAASTRPAPCTSTP